MYRCKRKKKPTDNDNGSTEGAQIGETNENVNRQKYYCELCNRTSSSKHSFERHKVQVHKIGGHRCDYCKKIFLTSAGKKSIKYWLKLGYNGYDYL